MLTRLIIFCSPLFAMARCAAAPIDLSKNHHHRLEAIVWQHHAPQSQVCRARTIVLAGAGVSVRETVRALGVSRATVQRWRQRWSAVRRTVVRCPAPGYPADIRARADL